MTRASELQHRFVEYIPEQLDERTLYVSVQFGTVVHRCCCGCGAEVVTPLTPTDWKLTFDGETISLHPSIGNWSYPCRSHYWIRNNRVSWAGQWSQSQIDRGRNRDRLNKAEQFGAEGKTTLSASVREVSMEPQGLAATQSEGLCLRLWRWLFRS